MSGLSAAADACGCRQLDAQRLGASQGLWPVLEPLYRVMRKEHKAGSVQALGERRGHWLIPLRTEGSRRLVHHWIIDTGVKEVPSGGV